MLTSFFEKIENTSVNQHQWPCSDVFPAGERPLSEAGQKNTPKFESMARALNDSLCLRDTYFAPVYLAVLLYRPSVASDPTIPVNYP